MFKKKYSIGFCTIFALVSFLFLSPCCLAMSKSEAFEICRNYCGASYLFDTPNVSPGNSSWKSYSDYLSYLDTRTERVMIVCKSNNSAFNSTSASPYINFFDNIDTSSGYQCITTTARRGDLKTVNQSQAYLNFYRPGQGDSFNVGTSSFVPPTSNYTFYMIYYDGNIIAASFVIPPTTVFNPEHDYIVTVNNYSNVNAILRNYSVFQWQIGDTDDYDTLDAFQFYLNDLTLGYRVGNVHYYTQYGLSYDGCLFYSQDNLYVSSRYISYNHLYQLIVSKTNGEHEDLEYYYFVFLPRDAVISNGEIISVGSGDYSVQDSTNAIIDNENDLSAVEDLQAELLESGELIKRLDYRVYPNHSYDIIFALTQNIVDTLYYSGDTYIDIAIGDRYSHRFYASDFSIPINGLTYWIYMALTFGYCYLLYKQGAQLIHAIQEGDLMVLELEDAEEYFYM